MAMPALMLTTLSLICLTSFGWAITWHFARPERTSWPMMCVASLATAFGLMQMAATVWDPAIAVIAWLLAAILYGMALSLFWWAVRTTRGHRFCLAFTVCRPSMMLAEGPYRWVRHPFYTSYMLYWIAGIFATKAWWPIIPVLVMGGMYWRAAIQEETEFLKGDQAKGYRSYITQSGRFFPKLRRSQEALLGVDHSELSNFRSGYLNRPEYKQ